MTSVTYSQNSGKCTDHGATGVMADLHLGRSYSRPELIRDHQLIYIFINILLFIERANHAVARGRRNPLVAPENFQIGAMIEWLLSIITCGRELAFYAIGRGGWPSSATRTSAGLYSLRKNSTERHEVPGHDFPPRRMPIKPVK